MTKPSVTEPTATQPSVVKPPKDENNEAELQAKYEYAIELLEYSSYSDAILNGKRYYGLPETNNDLKEAYELFVELGDYLDAEEYVKSFIVIPDVLLSVYAEDTYPADDQTDFIFQDTYHYDADGLLFLTVGEYSQYVEYQCDQSGKIIRVTEQNMWASYTDHYSYNNQGDLTKITRYDESSSNTNPYTAEEYSYEYDSKKRIIQKERIVYRDGGNEVFSRSITKYEYDSQGRIIREEETEYRGSDVYLNNSEYIYNANGYTITTHSNMQEYYTTYEYTYGTYYYYPSTSQH